jgi:hypothetical protein
MSVLQRQPICPKSNTQWSRGLFHPTPAFIQWVSDARQNSSSRSGTVRLATMVGGLWPWLNAADQYNRALPNSALMLTRGTSRRVD